MTLVSQADKLVKNQHVHRALNAFIGPLNGCNASTDESSTLSSLSRRYVALKDNFCTAEQPTTCASEILNGFQSPFDATVVEKLKASGALIAGKTNMDEFGMGSDTVNSSHGPVANLYTRDGDTLSAGGSSGGSAMAVSAHECYGALGTDTGGSVRLPAAYTGLVGFKPSYGLISRRGVVAYANSLDTVGILARDVTSVKQLFDVIQGYDAPDPTSIPLKARSRILQRTKHANVQEKGKKNGSLRIGVPREYNTLELQPVIRMAWTRTLQQLQDRGHYILPVSLPMTRKALSAYYVLAPAEASSNLAKYDGVRYGNKTASRQRASNVLFSATRGDMLGEEVQRRILLGSYSLSAGAIDNYFIKAQKLRRLVQQDFNRVFALDNPLQDATIEIVDNSKVDYILTPTVQSLPPKLKDVQNRSSVEAYGADVLTVPASLAGLPAVSVPVPIPTEMKTGFDDIKTVGMQITGQYGDDDGLLSAALLLESLLDA